MSVVTRLVVIVLSVATFVGTHTSRAHAQSSHDFQTWSALFATGQLQENPEGFNLWFDVHVRRGDAGTVGIFRPGLGYRFNPWLSVWVGYAWVPTFIDAEAATDSRIDEQRAWQQVILTHKWLNGALAIQGRTRLEQRFREDSSDIGHRARQFVRLDYRPDAQAVWGLVFWDELFWGLNAPDFAPQGFDQNRIFVGGALYTMPKLRVEAGYLSALLHRDDALQFQHALALNFFTSF